MFEVFAWLSARSISLDTISSQCLIHDCASFSVRWYTHYAALHTHHCTVNMPIYENGVHAALCGFTLVNLSMVYSMIMYSIFVLVPVTVTWCPSSSSVTFGHYHSLDICNMNVRTLLIFILIFWVSSIQIGCSMHLVYRYTECTNTCHMFW